MTFTLHLARHRRRRAPASGEGRRGFTVLELLTVLMVMGTVGRVAVPNLHELVLQARAQEVARDVAQIHLAAVEYQRDQGSWPDDAWEGVVPDGLEEYLPEGFDFQGEGYRLDWQNWTLPDGLPDDPDVTEVLAISVITEDPGLGQSTASLLGGALGHYLLDDTHTFVLSRS